jgi:hypothetical protein
LTMLLSLLTSASGRSHCSVGIKFESKHLDTVSRMEHRIQNVTSTTSEICKVSTNNEGDIFSFEELEHLPIISSRSSVHVNMPLSKNAQLFSTSPQLFSLVTPEKRFSQEVCRSVSTSKRSSDYMSTLPSPSKLLFSPLQHLFSPSNLSPPKCHGKFQL